MSSLRLLGATCVVVALSIMYPSFAQDDCEFIDEFGESQINNGGAALAAVIATLPGQGIGNIPVIFQGPYAEWDINNDGVPDADQFELLTALLCLPDGVEHPALDIAFIKDAFDANLVSYWDMVDLIFDNEEEIVELAPLAEAVGSQLRTAVGPGKMGNRNEELDPCVFLGCELPESWENKTYGDLADTLFDLGDGVMYLINKGLYGSEGSTMRVALVNDATAYFMAAAMGLDDTLLNEFFNLNRFGVLEEGLILTRLDWDFLNDLFDGYVNPETSTEFGDLFASLDLPENILPDPAEDILYYEWNNIFYDDVYQQGGIEDLIDSVTDELEPYTMPVRVIHASPDLDAIAICQEDALFFDNLSFRDITPYQTALARYPSFRYDFGLAMAGDDCSNTLMANSYDLQNTSTLLVMNRADYAEFLMIEDILDMPRNGNARIRFVNTSPDAGPLTLAGSLNGGEAQPLFSNVGFRGVSAYKDVPPGIYNLDFLSAGKGDTVLPSETTVLRGGTVYSLFAMGFADDLRLSINEDAVPGTVTLTVDPDRNNFFAGETVTIQATCSEELIPLSYFWSRNGVALAHATAELTLTDIAEEDAGYYAVTVLAGAQGVVGEINVSATAAPIEITKASVSISGRRDLSIGDSLRLTANVTGDVNVTAYNWTWSLGALAGADTTAQTLEVLEVDAEHSGTYLVEVEVALPEDTTVRKTIAAEAYVRINLDPMPASIPAGLLILSALLLSSGIVYFQKRKVISHFEK
jgi:hypothetical protein